MNVKLPSSRDFARRYKVSRGTVVSAFERLQFERLQDEGYLSSHVGAGSWVNPKVRPDNSVRRASPELPVYVRRIVSKYKSPRPFVNWVMFRGTRPFSMRNPALADFPVELWGRIATRRFHSSIQPVQALRPAVAKSPVHSSNSDL